MGQNSHPTSGILTTADANGTDLNLFNNYGQMSASDITTNSKIYVDAETRQTQKNYQLYHCLKNSLTASGTAKIISKSNKYHIASNPCGYLLFKVPPQKYIIYNMETASNMRENLYSLDTYIAIVNSEIEKFNEYANISYEVLTARCERFNNIMLSLSKGCIAARDKDFVR